MLGYKRVAHSPLVALFLQPDSQKNSLLLMGRGKEKTEKPATKERVTSRIVLVFSAAVLVVVLEECREEFRERERKLRSAPEFLRIQLRNRRYASEIPIAFISICMSSQT